VRAAIHPIRAPLVAPVRDAAWAAAASGGAAPMWVIRAAPCLARCCRRVSRPGALLGLLAALFKTENIHDDSQALTHSLTHSLTQAPSLSVQRRLLKDMEKAAAKKGVVFQAVKDVVQALVDDSLVHVDKIGTSNWYWAGAYTRPLLSSA
jgi:hypothetical protein